jgi:alpha-mannosidase
MDGRGRAAKQWSSPTLARVHDDRELVEARIRRTLRERIEPEVHGPGSALEVTALVVPGEPIGVDEARAGSFVPFPVGGAWGTPWSTTWFRMSGEVPSDWAGERVEAVVDLGGGAGPGFSAEALVWDDDGPRHGLHPDHRSVVIGAPVQGGEPVDLLIEAAANPSLVSSFRPSPMGDRATAPEVALYRLARAELAVRRDEVWHLVLDLKALVRLMIKLPTDEPRRHLILRAVERALDALDLHDVPATATQARAELAGVLDQPAHASAHTLHAIGHAHIDTAWLWPLRETRRKCTRTFSTALELMDEYPEYRFAASQAQQYAWVRDEHPQLFERIRERVAEGRFVPIGGMWVEADCNIPSGESLARQLVHGKRWFREVLGVETDEVWIPDVFGYAGNLPQIMALAGARWFLTQKLSWNQTNRFPHHTFWWEGIDGTRVYTHFPPAETYNGSFHADELLRAVHTYRDHGRGNRSLYPFGHGDGGGGPTREMLELARRYADLEGAPKVVIEPPSTFFEQAHAEDPDAPVWRGELYFEMHRGTYTTQARTKWGNRRGELLLREAELWSVLAQREHGEPYPAEELDGWWKVLLLHQFHDIIPGSSIAWVHQDTEADHARLHDAAEAIVAGALGRLADHAGEGSVVLANAATHDRHEVVTVPGALAPAGETDLVATQGGAARPAQRLASGDLAFQAEVPGLGLASVTLGPGEAPQDGAGAVRVDERSLANDLLSVQLDDRGLVTSLHHHQSGRDALSAPGNLLQLHPDHPTSYDAWDLDAHHRHVATDLIDVEAIEVVEPGPVVGSIRLSRRFGSSRIVQTLTVTAGSPELVVDTEVDWHEDEKVLKVAFPLDVRADDATYEVQFGHVRRPMHTNTSWDDARFEVCGHTWADVSEHGFGVALLNDSKYGHDARDGVLRLTLLRAPRYPDPQADRGQHRFRYALRPHAGSFQDDGVPEAGHALNLPIRAVPGSGNGGGGALPAPVVSVDHPGVVVEAVKLAEDGSGDLVVRCYESFGGRATATIGLGVDVGHAALTDLLEDDLDPPEPLTADDDGHVRVTFGPFQIRTIRARHR